MSNDLDPNIVGPAAQFARGIGKAETTPDLVLAMLAQYESRLQSLLDQADTHKQQMGDTLILFRQLLSQRHSSASDATGPSKQRTQAQWQEVLGRVLSEGE